MKKTIAAAGVLAVSCIPSLCAAATVPAAGYIYTRRVLSELTEGCIAPVAGGVFVGVGPALSSPATGGTRRILFVSESGAVRTVATGLNSISDCSWDASEGILYVTDSGQEFAGATTGDTVFAIPGSSSGVAVAGLELLPAGTIPYAFAIDLTSSGLIVTNAAGGGQGTVLSIDASGNAPVVSTFASGFDYTGGVLWSSSGVLIAQSVEPTFESMISSYLPNGTLDAVFSGPTYDHGSVDLARTPAGDVVASGAPTLVAIDSGGASTPLVTGLDGGTGYDAFGGGVAVNPSTGRIDFLASSFSGDDDDKSLHRLTPVAALFAGGGSAATDCALEVYGVQLVAKEPGMAARSAICTDGAACDSDGRADGTCTFPIGLCINVEDSRLTDCIPSGLASVDVLSTKPESTELQQMVDELSSMLPSSEETCVFSDGMRVPVRTSSGGTRAGKGTIKLGAITDDPSPKKDTDVIRLVCEPAQP